MTNSSRPAATAAELPMLLGWLGLHRDILRGRTQGLDADGLGVRLPPSTLTLGGLLTHLAFVEDFWSGWVLLGEPPVAPWDRADWDADPDWEMSYASGRVPDELHSLFDSAVATTNERIAALAAGPEGLDTLSAQAWHGERVNLRWVLVHLIEEYARHNGHADLIRESIDGTVGDR